MAKIAEENMVLVDVEKIRNDIELVAKARKTTVNQIFEKNNLSSGSTHTMTKNFKRNCEKKGLIAKTDIEVGSCSTNFLIRLQNAFGLKGANYIVDKDSIEYVRIAEEVEVEHAQEEPSIDMTEIISKLDKLGVALMLINQEQKKQTALYERILRVWEKES